MFGRAINFFSTIDYTVLDEMLTISNLMRRSDIIAAIACRVDFYCSRKSETSIKLSKMRQRNVIGDAYIGCFGKARQSLREAQIRRKQLYEFINIFSYNALLR